MERPIAVLEGGRGDLERCAVRAVALGLPEADALSRMLDRASNACLSVVTTAASEETSPARSDADTGGHQNVCPAP